WAVLGQKIFALAEEQAVHRREAFNDLLAVVGRVRRLRTESRSVQAVGEFRLPARDAHLVRPRAFELYGSPRSELSRDRTQAAQAGPRRDELDPHVRAALDDLQTAQGRTCAAPFEPLQQLLEVYVNGERARLIDQAEAGGELRDQDRAPAAVRVPCVAFDADEE